MARALQGLSGVAWPGLLSENAHHSRTRALFSRNRFFDFGWLLASFSLQNPTLFWHLKTDTWRPFSALGCFGRLWPLLASPWPPFGLPLASLWPPLASPWPPFGLSLASLGLPLASFWPPLVSLGRPLAPLACPLAHLSVPLALPWRLLASLGVLWRPFGLPYRKKQDDRGQRTQNHMTKKAWMGFPIR